MSSEMEEIASADLIELLLLQREAIDVQFQFWISVTFALVVACFVAGSKIQPGYRLLLGGLYLMATATFLSRWIYDGLEIQAIFEVLQKRGIPYGNPSISVGLRWLVTILGTASATFILLRGGLDGDFRDSEQRVRDRDPD